MKTHNTLFILVIVVAVHGAIAGSLVFMQGCGTPRGATTPLSAEGNMPPLEKPMPAATLAATPAATAVVTGRRDPGVTLAPQEPRPPLPSGTVEYVVKAGDSIEKIARKHNTTKAEIAALNKLADLNKIKAGQKLMLPAKAAAEKPVATAVPEKGAAEKPVAGKAPAATPKASRPAVEKEAAVEAVKGAAGDYVVKSGDSLSRIAAQHGVKVSALRDANKLQDDKIKPGQKLVIPAGSREDNPKDAVKPAASPKMSAAPAPAAAKTMPAAAPAVARDAAAAVAPAKTLATPKAPVAGLPDKAPATPVPPAKTAAPIVIPADPPALGKAPAAASMPAAVATEAAAYATASEIWYPVQPDDTLQSIANSYAVTVDEIAELNKMGTNRTVHAGQKLKIP